MNESSSDRPRKASGTYALLLRAEEPRTIEVGALGAMAVQRGAYVYVGSAFGPGGLRARVERHVRGDGARHWHVDYLRAAAVPHAVWYTHDAERRECTWASILRARPSGTVPLAGFGASDCDCPAHLVRFNTSPRVDAVRHHLRAACPGHDPIRRWSPTAEA